MYCISITLTLADRGGNPIDGAVTMSGCVTAEASLTGQDSVAVLVRNSPVSSSHENNFSVLNSEKVARPDC